MSPIRASRLFRVPSRALCGKLHRMGIKTKGHLKTSHEEGIRQKQRELLQIRRQQLEDAQRQEEERKNEELLLDQQGLNSIGY